MVFIRKFANVLILTIQFIMHSADCISMHSACTSVAWCPSIYLSVCLSVTCWYSGRWFHFQCLEWPL